MDKKPDEIHRNLIPSKLTNVQYSINSYTAINTPYDWPAFLAASCLNIGYVSLYELIRIHCTYSTAQLTCVYMQGNNTRINCSRLMFAWTMFLVACKYAIHM